MKPENTDNDVMSAAFWEKQVKEKLDPRKAEQLERIVIAGMKIMFSKETHQMMLDELNSEAPIVQKLSEGILKLMTLMLQQSNGTMPRDLIIPAAGILLARAVEFLVKTGEEVTEDDFRMAMEEMVKLIMKQAGQSDGQAEQAAQQAGAEVEQAQQAQPARPTGMLAQGA